MEMKSAYPDLTVLKIGEPFYRPLLQGCPDVPKYPELLSALSKRKGGFQVVIGIKYFLRPSQTCKCTREYLFRTLQ